MVRRLVLHIGTAKAGSTSIQHFLQQNQLLLQRAGYELVTCFGGFSQAQLPIIFYNSNHQLDFLTKRYGLITHEMRLQFGARKRRIFEQQLDASDAQQWILSSEFISYHLRCPAETQQLLAYLQELFDQIHLVYCARHALAAALSLHSTLMQLERTCFSLGPPQEYELVGQHQQNLALWRPWLRPQDSLAVVPLQANAADQAALHRQFCASAQIPWQEYRIPERLNPSMSFKAMKVMSIINAELPLFIKNRVNPARGTIAEWVVQRYQDWPKYQVGSAERECFTQYYSNSSAWLNELMDDAGIDRWDQLSYGDEAAKFSSLDQDPFGAADQEEAEELIRQWKERKLSEF